MKAVRLHSPASVDNLFMDRIEVEPPGAGEISVRVRAASLNYRDGLVVNGFFPVADGLIPLSDGAGEVVAVGEGVSEYAVGDAVISTFHPGWSGGHIERAQLVETPGGPMDGFACQVVTRPVRCFTAAPRTLTWHQRATLTCAGLTAWRAVVTDARVKPGDQVLVLGAGGVSLFALQFAKACGARVIATTSGAARQERLQALGADHVINYREESNWGETVAKLSDGGVDAVVEVGGPNTMAQSLAAARTGAHIALIGAVAGFDHDTMPFATLQAKRLRVQGVTVGSREDQLAMVRAIDQHGIQPVIDRSFPLEQLADAFRAMESDRPFGKIVVDLE